MELRVFGKILKRRWWLIIIPPIVVVLVSLITYQTPPPAGFNAGVNFIVSQTPAEHSTNLDENQYYNWLDSEYVAGGLKDWANGSFFKTAVSAQLAAQGVEIPPHTFQVVADNVRSKVQLSIQHAEADTLSQIMEAAMVVMAEQNASALPQLGGDTAVVVLLDQPVITPIPPGLRNQLDIPLRIALALIGGLGLALLVEYLDTTIRDREEVEQLGLSLMGEIPEKGKR
jgi:capsular polysaccharide biosynthesis protein